MSIGTELWLCRNLDDAAHATLISLACRRSSFPRPYIWRFTSLSAMLAAFPPRVQAGTRHPSSVNERDRFVSRLGRLAVCNSLRPVFVTCFLSATLLNSAASKAALCNTTRSDVYVALSANKPGAKIEETTQTMKELAAYFYFKADGDIPVVDGSLVKIANGDSYWE